MWNEIITYLCFTFRHFSNQTGIIVFGHVPIVEFSNWLRRVFWGRILRGRHHGTRLWNCLDVKSLWRIPQCSGRHEHDAEHGETIHDTVIFNQCCFAFIRPHTHLVYRYHVISRTQSNIAVFGCPPSGPTERHSPCRSTVEQLLYWSDCMGTGRAVQIDPKTSDSGV